MKFAKINLFSFFILLFLLNFFNAGCNEVPVETKSVETQNVNINNNKSKIPDTFVHGYVTRNGSPVVGVKVQLWKNGTLLPSDFRDSPYTDENGYYKICVCCKGAGTGTYVVRTKTLWHGETWAQSESFYWDVSSGPWDFEIDLPLIRTEQ